MSENSNIGVAEISILVGGAMLFLYATIAQPIYEDWIKFKEATNWAVIGYTTYYISFLTIMITIVSIIVYKSIKKYNNVKHLEWENIERTKEEKQNKIDYLKNLLKDDFSEQGYYLDTEEIKNRIIKTNKAFKQMPSGIKSRYKEKIKRYNLRANGIIKYLKGIKQERIEEEQRKREAVEKKKKEVERQVQELLEFKKKKNSIEAVPLEHNYTEDIIHRAKERMGWHMRKKEYIKSIKEQAIEYYKYNDINTKPYISNKEDEEIYEQVRNDIKSGKIKLKKELVIVGGKLKEKFYMAKGLSDEIKRKALSQGFKHIRGVDLDGKVVPGGFYINKESNKESDYHFYTKYLLKEIDERIRIEYGIEDKRVDAAIIVDFIKVGIEIETGTNDNQQLAEKIEWLNNHFNLWLFIVPRKHLERYSLYVDNKQSFCHTPKNGKKWVIDTLASIDQQ